MKTKLSELVKKKPQFDKKKHEEEMSQRTLHAWPYCPKCGRVYISVDTEYSYIKDVVPACRCGVDPHWTCRPAGEWNT